jgi:sensor c-di-GMP phosphodiesterase-like protein
MLRAQGATLAQGFLFGRPMPVEDFVAFASESHEDRAVNE